MNERIKELWDKAAEDTMDHSWESQTKFMERFAKLIVRECIERAQSVGDLRGATDDMIYGADMAAVKISKHFGFE